ncbi:amidohydrolase family protein [Dactylosporangium fulvum]|uniref:Amidohydrolase n=1 Tax=Dactylosporangium fulvum TaxID=53359 RepID=A0ABY5VRS1_9ACTN|nr:amidohydrolase family protein [Dactylosporangium fulvum]UWP80245.1 amidohydrolase [Dactylosporangium fulvum]
MATSQNNHGRIDTHQHFIPPVWASYLDRIGYLESRDTPRPTWSPQAALQTLDRLAISTAIVSVSRPGIYLSSVSDARSLAVDINDFAAALKRDFPGRFGFFGVVPFPDVDASLAEAERCLDQLGASGIVLLTNTAGHYLGDPVYDPLLQELDRRGSVLFVHPTMPPAELVPGIPPFVVDFLLDTTRAAINLVRAGVPRRYKNLRIILSHGGGFVPYVAERIARVQPAEPGQAQDPEAMMAGLRSFYFDTALTGGGLSLSMLREFAGADRVLFGSDWPYAPGTSAEHFTDLLDKSVSADDATAINRGNAVRLFPEFDRAPE